MNYSWKTLDFDSSLFGSKIAKIETIESLSSVTRLTQELKRNAIQYASFRVQSSNARLIAALQNNSFQLVDGLIAMEINLKKDTLVVSKNIRKAKQSDQNRLFSIASESFTSNRFYNDRFFSDKKEKVKELYGKWAVNSLKGEAADAVFVYEEEKIVEGFTTVQNSGHIPLVAVEKGNRGKGIAKDLIVTALAHFQQKKVEKVKIEAVIMNIPALRSYQACGFKIVDSYFTFAWHNDDTLTHH